LFIDFAFNRTALLELLSTFLKRTSHVTALTALHVFVCKELPDSECKNSFLQSEVFAENSSAAGERSEVRVALMARHCRFGYGETGGVILEKVDPSTAEEDPLQEMLGKENGSCETRALCLVEVLQNLRKDEIPGNFFLYLLQQVQEIILKPNFRENGKMKTLVIFNALALMCEKLGPSVLKNAGHMIQFVETTLTRAHHVFMESMGVAGVFEMETVTMALGMLSALLGGAVKVCLISSSNHSFDFHTTTCSICDSYSCFLSSNLQTTSSFRHLLRSCEKSPRTTSKKRSQNKQTTCWFSFSQKQTCSRRNARVNTRRETGMRRGNKG
jgi:hypothetical protein